MNTSAKFNALFRDVSVGALSALTIYQMKAMIYEAGTLVVSKRSMRGRRYTSQC